MPTPVPVERSQPIEKVHLDELAAYANGKSRLTGKPYAFQPTAGWKTELNRMRRNLFEQFQSNPAYVNIVNTGPLLPEHYVRLNSNWMISESAIRLLQGIGGGGFISHNGLITTVASPLISKASSTDSTPYYYFPENVVSGTVQVRSLIGNTLRQVDGRSARDVSYVYSEPATSGLREVTTTLHLNKNLWLDGSDEDPGFFRFDDRSELTWSLQVDVPETSIFRGSCLTPFFKSTSTVNPDIELTGNFSDKITKIQFGGGPPNYTSQFKLSWEFEWLDRTEFNLGIIIKNFDPDTSSPSRCHFIPFGNSSRLLGPDVGNDWAYLEWQFKSPAQLFPVLEPNNPTYSIVIPNCSVTHSPNSAGYNPSTGWREIISTSGHRFSGGNLGRIMHSPSLDILNGCFLGKTFPIRAADMNPKKPTSASSYTLNPTAKNASVGSENFNAVAPAIDFVIPEYPIRHINEPESEMGQSHIAKGAIIFKVAIWRSPVLAGEIYQYATPVASLSFQIGFIRSGEFVKLLDVNMGEENEIELYPGWLIFEPGVQLVHDSPMPININANLIANTAGTNYVFGGTLSADKTELPVLSEHYNDTLSSLNLLI